MASRTMTRSRSRMSVKGDSNGPQTDTCNYRVYIRCRPFLPNDLEASGYPLPAFEIKNGQEIVFMDPQTGLPKENFLFDGAYCSIAPEQWQEVPDLSGLPPDSPYFPPTQTQAGMFETCARPVVQYVLDGFNASILAYGQTSSGKTHTMMGTPSDEGIIPRLCMALLEGAQQAIAEAADAQQRGVPRQPGVPVLTDFSMDVAFFEIYNENVLDLLESGATHGQHRRRKVRTHPSLGVFIEGLTYEPITSWGQCSRVIERGIQRRHVASTKMNDQSSRSHAVMQLRMTQTEMSELGPLQRRSNVYLADLAGSERIKASQVEGDRLKEAAQINLSLTTLRRVIDALITPKGKNDLVPYRDSMLTWVLSEALGGNAKSCMIATLCPNPKYAEESFNTLQYASRAKSIVSSATRNEDQMAQMIRSLQETIAREAAAGGAASPTATAEQVAQFNAQTARLAEADATLVTTRDELSTTTAALEVTQERLQREQRDNARLAEERRAAGQELLDRDVEIAALRARLSEMEDAVRQHKQQREAAEHQVRKAAEERRTMQQRLRHDAAQAYMPMLRWYHATLALLDDAFFDTHRYDAGSTVVTSAVHEVAMTAERLQETSRALAEVSSVLSAQQTVATAQQEALTRVAAVYVRVRDFLEMASSGDALNAGNGTSNSSSNRSIQQRSQGGAARRSGSGPPPSAATLRSPEAHLASCTGLSRGVGGTIPSDWTVVSILDAFRDFVRVAESDPAVYAKANALQIPGDRRQPPQQAQYPHRSASAAASPVPGRTASKERRPSPHGPWSPPSTAASGTSSVSGAKGSHEDPVAALRKRFPLVRHRSGAQDDRDGWEFLRASTAGTSAANASPANGASRPLIRGLESPGLHKPPPHSPMALSQSPLSSPVVGAFTGAGGRYLSSGSHSPSHRPVLLGGELALSRSGVTDDSQSHSSGRDALVAAAAPKQTKTAAQENFFESLEREASSPSLRALALAAAAQQGPNRPAPEHAAAPNHRAEAATPTIVVADEDESTPQATDAYEREKKSKKDKHEKSKKEKHDKKSKKDKKAAQEERGGGDLPDDTHALYPRDGVPV